MSLLQSMITALLSLFALGAAEAPPEVAPIPVVPYQATWKCIDCTPEEQYVLAQLQEKTKISDRNALATIMGNIKQESKFISRWIVRFNLNLT